MESMKGFEFKAPSLDLGCGDGTFSFLRAGGNLMIHMMYLWMLII